MSIPDFNENGVLPEGIYKATIKEIKEVFCSFGDTTKRNKLFNSFLRYLTEVKKHNIDYEIYIDGSFVTDKESPGDIDILLFFDFEYQNEKWLDLISDMKVRIKFQGIQVLSAFTHSFSRDNTLDFAHDVKDKPNIRKGLIEVIL